MVLSLSLKAKKIASSMPTKYKATRLVSAPRCCHPRLTDERATATATLTPTAVRCSHANTPPMLAPVAGAHLHTGIRMSSAHPRAASARSTMAPSTAIATRPGPYLDAGMFLSPAKPFHTELSNIVELSSELWDETLGALIKGVEFD